MNQARDRRTPEDRPGSRANREGRSDRPVDGGQHEDDVRGGHVSVRITVDDTVADFDQRPEPLLDGLVDQAVRDEVLQDGAGLLDTVPFAPADQEKRPGVPREPSNRGCRSPSPARAA